MGRDRSLGSLVRYTTSRDIGCMVLLIKLYVTFIALLVITPNRLAVAYSKMTKCNKEDLF